MLAPKRHALAGEYVEVMNGRAFFIEKPKLELVNRFYK